MRIQNDPLNNNSARTKDVTEITTISNEIQEKGTKLNEDNEIVNNLGNVEKKSTRSKADKKKSKIQDQGEKKESGPASVSMKNMCSGNNRGKDGMLKTEDNDKTDSALKNPQEVCSNSSKGQIVIAILTAIIAGLVVAFFAPNIQDWHDARRRIKEQDESLERIQIGMNRGHIDDLFGNPLFINNVDADYTIKAGGKFQSAAYKLHEKSLLCLYQDDTLAAFVVMTKKTDQYTFERYGLYKEGTNPSEYTFTVSDFTYEECNGSNITDFKGYYPIMGSYHIMYYYEITGGTHPDNFEYTILGTYRNYMDKSDDVIALMSMADSLGNKSHHERNDSETLSKATKELSDLRKKVHPDVYGLSKYLEFNFVVDVIQNGDNSLLLTSDD